MTLPLGTPTELFIGGKWTGGSAGQLRRAGPLDRRGALRRRRGPARTTSTPPSTAAADAQPEWAAAPPRERGEVLRRAFELMIEQQEDLAFLMSLEMGKSLTDARGEVDLRRRVLPLVLRGGGAHRRRAAHGAVRGEPHPDLPQAGRRLRCC